MLICLSFLAIGCASALQVGVLPWHTSRVLATMVDAWPTLGGASGPHRMAGTMPPPPTREEWLPPPGWRPPSKPVLSWYDSGLRLEAPVSGPEALAQVVSSWYDSGVRMRLESGPEPAEAAPLLPPLSMAEAVVSAGDTAAQLNLWGSNTAALLAVGEVGGSYAEGLAVETEAKQASAGARPSLESIEKVGRLLVGTEAAFHITS